jgi:hypothetical protein
MGLTRLESIGKASCLRRSERAEFDSMGQRPMRTGTRPSPERAEQGFANRLRPFQGCEPGGLTRRDALGYRILLLQSNRQY